ncbi:MAG: HAD-IIB family hydrolase [Candidatus Gracilibacteria bacterium]|nr:HAD-IIB family hydrolase [Candidatus Gracilibacteria bacterium]
MFKMIVFDMDGTLTPSRGEMEPSMITLFKELLKKYKVGVISGGDFIQFQIQILNFIGDDEELLKNLYICPTCSTKMYIYKDKNWEKLYSYDFTDDEKNHIKEIFEKAINDLNLKPEKIYGELVEDRGTQVTYAVLGQQAPRELKSAYDPDFEKRKKIRDYIIDDLTGFDILIGGSTSIDVTRKGVDKAYGVQKLIETTGIEKNQIIFVGDAVFSGGNDFPPLEKLGITTKKVFNLQDTEEFIKELLK